MWLGTYLVRRGAITESQFVTAVERHLGSRIPIGQIAIEHGLLSISQLFEILDVQADSPRPFGQIATDLGFMTEKDVALLLMIQDERSKSIATVLVEMGAITQTELDRHRTRFRQGWGNELVAVEAVAPHERLAAPAAPTASAAALR
jgi:hypothetical protein